MLSLSDLVFNVRVLLSESVEETWGAGVDIHTVDTRPALFQFRTHFLVRFVPNKLPLPFADQIVLNDM